GSRRCRRPRSRTSGSPPPPAGRTSWAFCRVPRGARPFPSPAARPPTARLPVAPPRLVDPSLGDTIREHTGWYRTLAPLKVTNQYAAMPSLHVGWSLLAGIALARASRRRIAYPFAMLLPIAMALAVVMTANHYVLDAVVGAAVAAVALTLALHLPDLREVHRPIE